jgi:hypothetical protein
MTADNWPIGPALPDGAATPLGSSMTSGSSLAAAAELVEQQAQAHAPQLKALHTAGQGRCQRAAQRQVKADDDELPRKKDLQKRAVNGIDRRHPVARGNGQHNAANTHGQPAQAERAHGNQRERAQAIGEEYWAHGSRTIER